MTLRDRLAAEIAAEGPITVAQYMARCLLDPSDGYYVTRPALGEGGDFLTAPLVSQMFGELIGVWCVAAWREMGAPPKFRLVEIGPGCGALMSDLLRAARLDPRFIAAADVWLVEVSDYLKALQQARLGTPPSWAQRLADVPGGAPILLVANELLDCLPARQFVRTATGWAEQVVAVDETGALAFARAGAPPLPFPDAPEGIVWEHSPAQAAMGSEIGRRIADDGGAALLIDYGRDQPGFGDTLQALRRHRKEHPLESPGRADLTVHADFPAVLDAARAEGCRGSLLTQAEFLARLGIGERAEVLIRAQPDRAALIGRQLHRLIAADEMGTLFKAACIHPPDFPPPGFAQPGLASSGPEGGAA
jgi:SAM-dependent MidA family methyltransferase